MECETRLSFPYRRASGIDMRLVIITTHCLCIESVMTGKRQSKSRCIRKYHQILSNDLRTNYCHLALDGESMHPNSGAKSGRQTLNRLDRLSRVGELVGGASVSCSSFAANNAHAVLLSAVHARIGRLSCFDRKLTCRSFPAVPLQQALFE